MTDLKDKKDKPSKLTLGGSKLSLNRTKGQPNRPNTVMNSNSNTIIEVKKSKLTLNNNKINFFKELQQQDKEDELNKRVNLVRKAAEDDKHDVTFSSLSNLAALNNEEPHVVLDEVEIIEPSLLEEIKIDDKVIKNKEKVITPIISKYSASRLDEVDTKETKKNLSDHNKPVTSKVKIEDKKLKKTDIFHMLSTDETNVPIKTRSFASIRRAKEKEKRKLVEQVKVYREVIIPENITVGELASRMSERVGDVVKVLLGLGIIANVNQSIDADTAELVVSSLGHTLKRVQASDVENVLISEPDTEENLVVRPPVVTVMGHVDNGKTLLLDAIRSTNVVEKEAGGITQHIGAYKVIVGNKKTITFIDTPGHEAFTSMRTRGAAVTDIVILVVAADDGVKTQTIEAINHAKAANVPIIVAINKIDKRDIDIDKVKNELLTHGLVAEEYGGDTIIVPVSALKKTNLDQLLAAVLLVAEMLELRANPYTSASGVVIESKIDKGKGVIASILVKKGSLRVGDLVVAGSTYGKVKKMLDDKGENVNLALPSDPVEIYGLNESPYAGDKFDMVKSEKQARDVIEYRKNVFREKKNSSQKAASLEMMFDKASGKSNIKELNIIIKGDVQGSVEAIESSLLKIHSEEVKIKILHAAVGGITDSDISLAKASNAIIIGFNVRAASGIISNKDNVDIRYYSIIYDLIDDARRIVSGMLSPIIRESYIGSVDIREVFNITKVGKIAGCYVTRGVIKKGSGVRLIRDSIIIHQGKLKTLKRFKEEVKEVKEGFECGIAFENYEDIRVGDKLEVYEIIEEKQQL